jgi:hypothetical protein
MPRYSYPSVSITWPEGGTHCGPLGPGVTRLGLTEVPICSQRAEGLRHYRLDTGAVVKAILEVL